MKPGNIISMIIANNCKNQKDFAEKLGISTAYASDLESGKRKISIDIAIKIEACFPFWSASQILKEQVDYELGIRRNA